MIDLRVTLMDADDVLIMSLMDFYKCYYSEDNRLFNAGYLNWFLLSNPAGHAKCVTITLENEIVANMFLVPIFVTQNGKKRLGYFAADVLTHPNHRDKNLFVKMIRCATEYIKSKELFIVGHPNDASTPGWKRTKMSFYPEYRSFFSKVSFNLFDRRCIEIKHKDMLFSFAERIEEILIKNNQSIVWTDCEFLYWKYMLNPVKKYTIKAIIIDGCLRGIVVFYKYKKAIDRVVHYIVEEGYEEKVYRSSIIPRIYSFPQTEKFEKIKKHFISKNIGTEVRFFFTDYHSETPAIEPSAVTFAACDN
ncbi:GNAT family N-acetyltransferase [Vibrio cholerae]|nr:GNAT family N-acetyltransferase [Vibrio cholerae]